MALEVAEAAVVGDDLEPVAHRLPAAPGRWRRLRRSPASSPISSARSIGSSAPIRARISVLGDARRLEERRGEQVLLVAVDVDELDRGMSSPARRSRPSRATARSVASRRSRRCSIQSPPRSGRSTRATKLGITRSSSASIISPQARASGSGEAARRSSSCS